MIPIRRLLALILALVLLLSGTALASSGIDRSAFPERLSGEHFVVLYAKTGPSAVTAEYAGQVLSFAEMAYRSLVTEGGMNPPRSLPVGILLEADQPALGGEVVPRDLGFDLYIHVNPRMNDQMSLPEVVGHEFFHVLQSAYDKGGSKPVWAMEGTAPVGAIYAYPPDTAAGRDVREALADGPMAVYWSSAYSTPLKEQQYSPSLFWYWAADRFGGRAFLRRLLTWSADVEWERAAQLAALEGGAPAATTFDTLFRSFVFDMVQGRMPAGYTTAMWFHPETVHWTGKETAYTHSARVSGVSEMGQAYAYETPLVLGAYSFQLVQMTFASPTAAELTVTGDAGSVEAYVIRPGANLAAVLRDYGLQPQPDRPKAPPGDSDLQVARVTQGKPVRITGAVNDRALVLLIRTGNWGYGGYGLKLRPAGPDVPAPAWGSRDALPQPAHSPASPPPLSQAELAALSAGTWLTGVEPLQAETLANQSIKALRVTIGAASAWVGGEEYPLQDPVIREAGGDDWFPARAIAAALGIRVDGNRFVTPGGDWIQVTPGSVNGTGSGERHFRFRQAPRRSGDELLVTSDLFLFLGCSVTRQDQTYTLIFPTPDPSGAQ